MLKKLFILLILQNSIYSNIWDNLFSNDQDPSEKIQISHTKWKPENSYLFENYNIELLINPLKNKIFIKMNQEKKKIFEIFLDFNTNELYEKIKEKKCQKIVLPNLIKFDLSNINNMWDFVFFKKNENEYLLDLSFFKLSSYYFPETRLFYFIDKIVKKKKKILDKISFKFITKSLELKNTFSEIIDIDVDEVFEQKFNDCELYNDLRSFFDKFSKGIFSQIIENVYEKFIGKKNTNE